MPNVLVVALLIFGRMFPLAVMLPKVFSATASRWWGVGLTFIVSLSLAPKYAASASWSGDVDWTLAIALLREVVLGLALCLGFVVLLAGLFFAGAFLSQLSGINFPETADPQQRGSGENSLQRYLSWFALAVFLISSGHRQLVESLIDSFDWVPLGDSLPLVAPVPLAGEMLTQCFQSGLRVAAPVAFCLMVSSLLVAILARTLPSLGAFGVGIGVNLLVLLLVSCLSIEAMATAYQQSWSSGVDRFVAVWSGQAGSGP